MASLAALSVLGTAWLQAKLVLPASPPNILALDGNSRSTLWSPPSLTQRIPDFQGNNGDVDLVQPTTSAAKLYAVPYLPTPGVNAALEPDDACIIRPRNCTLYPSRCSTALNKSPVGIAGVDAGSIRTLQPNVETQALQSFCDTAHDEKLKDAARAVGIL